MKAAGERILTAIRTMLYIAYRTMIGLGIILKFIFLSESKIEKIERDETWIFRQIK